MESLFDILVISIILNTQQVIAEQKKCLAMWQQLGEFWPLTTTDIGAAI